MPFNIARRLFGIKEGETNQKVYDPLVTRGDLVSYDDALPISGGVTSVGTVQTSPTGPNNGAEISGSSLRLIAASSTYSGIVTTTTQTFSGNKTFSGNVTLSISSSAFWKTQVQTVSAATLNINSTSFNCTTQRITSGSGCVVTISSGPEAGSQIDIINDCSSGVVSFLAGSGMTVNTESGWLKLATRYTAATIIYTSASTAYIFGKLSA